MNKSKKTQKTPSIYKKVYPFFLLLATIFMGIGYAAVNSISSEITGISHIEASKGVFIEEVRYKNDVNADENKSKIIRAYQTMLNSDIILSSEDSESSITYTITIYNDTDTGYIFRGVFFEEEFYSNVNIIYSLTNLEVDDILKTKGSITFDITFQYVENVIPNENINQLNSYLNFKFEEYKSSYEAGVFGYAGGVQEFIAKDTGKYLLQVWGAQGGSASGDANGTYPGGKGGYSEGYINLESGDVLYIVIGEAGKSLHQNDYLQDDGTYIKQGVVEGGYNGGGTGYSNVLKYIEAPGGGATHIAHENYGELFNYADYKSDVIIVAGGGGGSNYENASWNCSSGGAGGGLTSPDVGHGGNGVAYGASTLLETPGTGGYFGQGGNGSEYPKNLLPGGGGGYYGGGFVTRVDGTINSNKGSSGGSGYLGGVYDGVSIAGNTSIPTYDGTSTMIGNTGNGYARIIFIEKIFE